MIKQGQVFVRAINAEGKEASVDVLDLDDVSFRAFVISKLLDAKMVHGIRDECCGGEMIELREKLRDD